MHVAFSVFPLSGKDETFEEVLQRDFTEWAVYPPIPVVEWLGNCAVLQVV